MSFSKRLFTFVVLTLGILGINCSDESVTDDGNKEPFYAVTYHGNGNTSGIAPVDGKSPYLNGSTVTILDGDNLVRTGYMFSGWNTATDGNGASYVAGNKFDIIANTTLYAKWAELPKYTVTYNGNGNTGGTVPIDGYSPYLSGSSVTVLNEGSLEKTGYTFGGWNTSPDGTGTNYSAGSGFIMPNNNLILYAWWCDFTDEVKSVNRFEAKPYTGNDKIKYSYSYGGYDFYYIYLGELGNIPMFYLDAQHFGSTAEMTYTFSTATTSTNSIRETVSNNSQTITDITDQHTYSITNVQKISTEINTKFNVVLVSELGGKIAGEESWSYYISGSQTTKFQQTTSLTNTVEHVSSFAEERRQTFTWPLSKSKGDREGWYRYTLFGASDIYLYVIKDSTGAIYYEFKEHIKPNVFGWMLDYSETMSFEKSDASHFEFDVSMLDDLPKPELLFTTQITSEVGFTAAGTYTYIFDKSFPATVEVYALGGGGGGQGGHIISNGEIGCGGGGGGGGTIYYSFDITEPITFDIKVGSGGSAGAAVDRNALRVGEVGSDGVSTSITWTRNSENIILTAAGGKGGGEGWSTSAMTVTNGGSGGGAGVNLATTVTIATGTKGDNGSYNGIVSSRGGDAGTIRMGSVNPFPTVGSLAGRGGTGGGGFSLIPGDGARSSGRGRDGEVRIVVTYHE